MRQEIGLAAHTGTTPPPLADHCRVPRTLERAKEYIWTWRILAHTEDVLRFVYGQKPLSHETWDELHDYLTGWRKTRPTSFDPIWKSGDESIEFPEMWFANDYHGQAPGCPSFPLDANNGLQWLASNMQTPARSYLFFTTPGLPLLDLVAWKPWETLNET
jgi:hypothetical protein